MVPKIFLLIPDASALLIKRLQGAGIAAGVSVMVAQSIQELPTQPPCGAILVVPANCKIQTLASHRAGWTKTLIVSTEHTLADAEMSYIIPSSMENPNTAWPRIMQAIIECEKKPFSGPSWHSIRLREQTDTFEFPVKFAEWTKRHKIISYASIGSILKSVEQLPAKLGLTTVDFEMSLDASSFQLTVSTSNRNHLTQQAFLDITSNPYAPISYVRRDETSLIAWLQVNFSNQDKIKICLLTNNDSAEHNDVIPEKDAS